MDDDDDDFQDVCHHGVGFDEDCEWCDLEIFEERQAARAAQHPQMSIFALGEST